MGVERFQSQSWVYKHLLPSTMFLPVCFQTPFALCRPRISRPTDALWPSHNPSHRTRPRLIYIEKSGLPEPTYDESYPAVIAYPADVEEARQAAPLAIDELHDYLMGPLGTVNKLVQGVRPSMKSKNERLLMH